MEEYMEEGFEPEAAAHNVYKNYQKHRREQNEIASMDFTRLYNFDAIKTLSALRLLTVRKMQK